MSNVTTLTEATFDAAVLGEGTTMVKFGATWCGPCKVMTPVLEKAAGEATFKIYDVDIDDSPGLAKKYSIRGVPCLLVFKDGVLTKTQTGLVSKEAILKLGA